MKAKPTPRKRISWKTEYLLLLAKYEKLLQQTKPLTTRWRRLMAKFLD